MTAEQKESPRTLPLTRHPARAGGALMAARASEGGPTPELGPGSVLTVSVRRGPQAHSHGVDLFSGCLSTLAAFASLRRMLWVSCPRISACPDGFGGSSATTARPRSIGASADRTASPNRSWPTMTASVVVRAAIETDNPASSGLRSNADEFTSPIGSTFLAISLRYKSSSAVTSYRWPSDTGGRD